MIKHGAIIWAFLYPSRFSGVYSTAKGVFSFSIVSKFTQEELRADIWPGMFCGHCGEREREGSAIITPLPGRRRHYHFLRHHRREREDGSDET